ncbi:MAG: condensation domain-containing protein [Moraxellaceae bacterium]|nr:condensation domain-containing protein [Moraxellaceae bacterium]
MKLSPHPDCLLLSFQEERALPWILDRSGLSSNVNAAVSCAGHLDAARLQRCLDAAAQRHDAIRTRFETDPGGGFRRVLIPDAHAATHLTTLVLGDTPTDPVVERCLADFCNRAFHIEDPHWLRAILLHTGDGSSVLALCMPHIVSDAVSMRMLITQLWRDHAALARGRPLPDLATRWQLRDFAGSQRAWGASPEFGAQLDALTAQTLHGIEEMRAARSASLLRDLRPPAASHSVAIRQQLSPALSEGLARLARDTRAGMFNTLTAGASLALARLFQLRHLCLRMPFSNRALAGTEHIVGFLANDVPLFIRVDEAESTRAFIRHVQQGSLWMMRSGALPWSLLNARLQADPVLATDGNPFDDFLVNIFPPADDLLVEDDPAGVYRARKHPLSLSGFTTNILKIWMHTANHQTGLILRVAEGQQALATDIYLPAFLQVFEAMVLAPDRPVGELLEDAAA